jgi:ribonuclease VapC
VSDLVADASAVLAVLADEPLSAFAPERIVGAWISAVNLAEVLSKLIDRGASEQEAKDAAATLELRVLPFEETHAHACARLRPETKRAGLSLADRACLATAAALKAPAVTADRAWARVKIETEVILVR